MQTISNDQWKLRNSKISCEHICPVCLVSWAYANTQYNEGRKGLKRTCEPQKSHLGLSVEMAFSDWGGEDIPTRSREVMRQKHGPVNAETIVAPVRTRRITRSMINDDQADGQEHDMEHPWSMPRRRRPNSPSKGRSFEQGRDVAGTSGSGCDSIRTPYQRLHGKLQQSCPKVPQAERNRCDSKCNFWSFEFYFRIVPICALSQLSLCTQTTTAHQPAYFSNSFQCFSQLSSVHSHLFFCQHNSPSNLFPVPFWRGY